MTNKCRDSKGFTSSRKIASCITVGGFPGCSDGKESIYNAGNPGSIPGLGRSLEKGMATHSSIFFLENSMGRRDGQAIVHEVTKRT